MSTWSTVAKRRIDRRPLSAWELGQCLLFASLWFLPGLSATGKLSASQTRRSAARCCKIYLYDDFDHQRVTIPSRAVVESKVLPGDGTNNRHGNNGIVFRDALEQRLEPAVVALNVAVKEGQNFSTGKFSA